MANLAGFTFYKVHGWVRKYMILYVILIFDSISLQSTFVCPQCHIQPKLIYRLSTTISTPLIHGCTVVHNSSRIRSDIMPTPRHVFVTLLRVRTKPGIHGIQNLVTITFLITDINGRIPRAADSTAFAWSSIASFGTFAGVREILGANDAFEEVLMLCMIPQFSRGWNTG